MLLTRKKFSTLLLTSLLCLATAAPSFAQGPGQRPGPPMERSFHEGHGRWWDNPRLAQRIGLSDDQKKQMDDIFMKHRLQLIDLKAALQKDEVVLHPMLQADQLDEQKVLSQIDAIAQDRANLEKANARMLFGIRKVLTPDQWKKLQTMAEEHHHGWGDNPCEWHGSHGPQGPHGPHPQGRPDQPGPPPNPPGE